MTKQTYGEILFKGIDHDAMPPEWVYTPWMRSMGDKGTAAVEVVARNGTELNWRVETKNSEDTDGGGQVVELGSVVTTSSTGVSQSSTLDGFKELYRFKFATEGGASTTAFVVFRDLPMSWHFDGRG